MFVCIVQKYSFVETARKSIIAKLSVSYKLRSSSVHYTSTWSECLSPTYLRYDRPQEIFMIGREARLSIKKCTWLLSEKHVTYLYSQGQIKHI